MFAAALLVAFSHLPVDRPPGGAVAVTPDGRRILTLSPQGVLRTFDAATGDELPPETSGHTDAAATPTLAPNGTGALLLPKAVGIRLKSPGADGHWNIVEERRSTAEAVGFSADGKAVAAAFRLDTGTTRLRIRRGAETELRHFATLGGHVHALGLSAEADWVVVLSHDLPTDKAVLRTTACQLFDVGTGRSLWSREEAFRHAVVTADDKYVILTGGLKAVPNRVLDLPDGEPCRDLRPPAFDIVGPPVVSPDGRTLFAATADAVVLWNLSTGRERLRLPMKGDDSPVQRMAISPDGSFLMTNFDGLRRWDTATGRPLFGPPRRGE